MKAKKRSRVVIDTNIPISFLIGKSFDDLDRVLVHNEFTLLYSKELTEEILEVIEPPKFSKYFGSSSGTLIKTIFKDLGEEINIRSKINACRDGKDNFLLALCRDGNADLLITSDQDLLVLNRFETTDIVTYKKFKNLI